MKRNFWVSTIKAALLVGTLDILAAFLQFFIKTGKGPALVLKFIASGIFGKDAFSSGDSMIFFGILFHYFNAFLFTVIFFWLCTKIPSLLKFKFLTAILYGIFIWLVMNLIVLPLSNTRKNEFNIVNAMIAASILVVCIGFPLSFMAPGKKIVNKPVA